MRMRLLRYCQVDMVEQLLTKGRDYPRGTAFSGLVRNGGILVDPDSCAVGFLCMTAHYYRAKLSKLLRPGDL